MSYIQSYKDLIVWQKAMLLAREIFLLTEKFPKSEIYGLISQMRRASVSIPSNIAEGYARRSKKEYLQFYTIAYGSALELETQMTLSKDIGLVPPENFLKSEMVLLDVLKLVHYMIIKLNKF